MVISMRKDIKITIPIFYDKKEDEYRKWWPQFKAYATQKEFYDVCQATRDTVYSEWAIKI